MSTFSGVSTSDCWEWSSSSQQRAVVAHSIWDPFHIRCPPTVITLKQISNIQLNLSWCCPALRSFQWQRQGHQLKGTLREGRGVKIWRKEEVLCSSLRGVWWSEWLYGWGYPLDGKHQRQCSPPSSSVWQEAPSFVWGLQVFQQLFTPGLHIVRT